MQKISFSVALAITLFTFTSCKKETTTPQTNCTNTTNWLKPAHQFVYENDPIYILADSLYINFTEVSPGIFKSISTFDDGTFYPATTSYIQPCNNNIYQGATATMDNKQEVYRTTGNVGDSWVTVLPSSGGNTITNTTTIVGINVSATVPAGTFSCTKMHTKSVSNNPLYSPVDTDFYLNNDAGLVKVEGTSAHYELVRKNY